MSLKNFNIRLRSRSAIDGDFGDFVGEDEADAIANFYVAAGWRSANDAAREIGAESAEALLADLCVTFLD